MKEYKAIIVTEDRNFIVTCESEDINTSEVENVRFYSYEKNETDEMMDEYYTIDEAEEINDQNIIKFIKEKYIKKFRIDYYKSAYGYDSHVLLKREYAHFCSEDEAKEYALENNIINGINSYPLVIQVAN